MNLKIEDVKVGDELECINDNYKNFNVGDIYKVNHIDKNGIMLSGFHGYWLVGVLQCFKKKEQSRYTFDDLVNVAFQAKKDGVVCEVIWNDFLSVSGISLENQIVVTSGQVSSDFICDAIKAIKALYKETFVIECEGDLKRIKKGAKILLLNGNSLEAMYVNLQELHVAPVADYRYLDILSLKGATVEQERGRDE